VSGGAASQPLVRPSIILLVAVRRHIGLGVRRLCLCSAVLVVVVVVLRLDALCCCALLSLQAAGGQLFDAFVQSGLLFRVDRRRRSAGGRRARGRGGGRVIIIVCDELLGLCASQCELKRVDERCVCTHTSDALSQSRE
jgi:hypothetical protein